MSENLKMIVVGNCEIQLRTDGNAFRSLGGVRVDGTAVRNPEAPFLPWFDSYDGEVFDRFELREVRNGQDNEVRVRLHATSNPDYPFRERRDCSGDLCLRNRSFDAPPATAALDIVLKPAEAEIDGQNFRGFTYNFEYTGALPIHRLLDRASWELGGSLEDVNLVCRNWLTPPRMSINRETSYSTVGLDKWAHLLPGNMWARWSLLPGFDMQYGQQGVIISYYDRVSLIRTTIESNAGEDAIRFNDFHWFEQTDRVVTNPKTILYSPKSLDAVDAMNLWTALQDRDNALARRQFDIPEEEPSRLGLHAGPNWQGFHFDESYEHPMEVAAEFGLDQIWIDGFWEHGLALQKTLEKSVSPEAQSGTIFEKYNHRNKCCILDFQVAAVHGGEDGLKRLCKRAKDKGLSVISWISTHVHPHSIIVDGKQNSREGEGPDGLPWAAKFKHGKNGAIAAMESGRHPSTGYPNSCWTLNLNSPVYEYLRSCILGICERTGLAGFLWDSFSNLGWWQVDYSDGTMRPQFDRMAALYSDLIRAGLYIQPEAITALSSHSCCGLHGGDVYAGDLLGYSYNTAISLGHTSYEDSEILRGQAPVEMMFRCLAHRRAPVLRLHDVPREQWDPKAAASLKAFFAMYRAARDCMKRRTVLKDDAGVLWKGKTGEQVIWSFRRQNWAGGAAVDLLDEKPAVNGSLSAWRVYRVEDA